MSRVIEARRALREAEAAFVEAARARERGAPNEAGYRQRLESIVAAYDAVRMSDPRLAA